MLRVQTTADYLPQDAISNAISDLVSELSFLEEKFKVRDDDRLSRRRRRRHNVCMCVCVCRCTHLTGGDPREAGWNGMTEDPLLPPFIPTFLTDD